MQAIVTHRVTSIDEPRRALDTCRQDIAGPQRDPAVEKSVAKHPRLRPVSLIESRTQQAEVSLRCRQQAGENKAEILVRPREAGTDPVVAALTAVLKLARNQPQAPSALLLDTVQDAIQAHLAHVRGAPGSISADRRRGLAEWQERRAKEFLAANAGANVSVGGAAAACKLSRSYFFRAFRSATGETPYQWLSRHRIDKARGLLLGSLSIAQIALDCGFSDQSHLTRVFSKMVGVPPGIWRREHRQHAEALEPNAPMSRPPSARRKSGR